VYKKDTKNRVADALSRRVHEAGEISAISTVQPQWLQLVQNSYSTDSAAKELLTKLSLDSMDVPNYTMKN
jgi:hypothetical protein